MDSSDRSNIASALSRNLFGNPSSVGCGKDAYAREFMIRHKRALKKIEREEKEKEKLVERLAQEYAGVIVKPVITTKRPPIKKRVKPVLLPRVVEDIRELKESLISTERGLSLLLEAIEKVNNKKR